MTEFNDPTPSSTRPAAVAEPPREALDAAGRDPLASLHKMSTTAGITSQEYVAINIPSIVALVLALASVVAVLTSVLLVVPLAAVVTAVIALRQINDSNGTQTGRGFAWLAIAVSLGIGGYKLVESVVDRYQSRADRQVIIGRIEELGRLLAARDYDRAYAMFSDRFKNRISPQTFAARWEATQSHRQLGRLLSMEWNQTTVVVQSERSTGVRVAVAAAWAKFEGSSDPARYTIGFRKSGSNWQLDDIPSMFPPPEKPRR